MLELIQGLLKSGIPQKVALGLRLAAVHARVLINANEALHVKAREAEARIDAGEDLTEEDYQAFENEVLGTTQAIRDAVAQAESDAKKH